MFGHPIAIGFVFSSLTADVFSSFAVDEDAAGLGCANNCREAQQAILKAITLLMYKLFLVIGKTSNAIGLAIKL